MLATLDLTVLGSRPFSAKRETFYMALEQNVDKTPLCSGKHKLLMGSSWLPPCPQISRQAIVAATLFTSSKNRQQNEREARKGETKSCCPTSPRPEVTFRIFAVKAFMARKDSEMNE